VWDLVKDFPFLAHDIFSDRQPPKAAGSRQVHGPQMFTAEELQNLSETLEPINTTLNIVNVHFEVF
jgi:hypothetical protein